MLLLIFNSRSKMLVNFKYLEQRFPLVSSGFPNLVFSIKVFQL